MLHSTKNMNKKSQMQFWVILLILAMVVLGIGFGIFYTAGQKVKQLAEISGNSDQNCLSISSPVLLGRPVIDIDKDGRDDRKCDVCVCPEGNGCNNNNKDLGGDDSDKDGVPDICDANPLKKEELPKLNSNNCPLDDKEKVRYTGTYGYQCCPLAPCSSYSVS